MRPTAGRKMVARLSEAKVSVLEKCRCVRTAGRGIVCRDKDGKEYEVQATGFVSENMLFQSLGNMAPNLFRAGDCIRPRTLVEAMDEGMQAGLAV